MGFKVIVPTFMSSKKKTSIFSSKAMEHLKIWIFPEQIPPKKWGNLFSSAMLDSSWIFWVYK